MESQQTHLPNLMNIENGNTGKDDIMIPFYENQEEAKSSALSEKVSKRETIEVLKEENVKNKNTISS